ncbi:MAG TPA: hypothetical protein VGQ35_08115 [Dongiaceae bacterium]|jgi:hypothetical protein|nr:hypothetical protein [Dongiaceae bacterium]
MSPSAPFLDSLEAAAGGASAAESAFRKEAAERIRTLERERSFAFRRLSVMRPIADAAGRAESEELSVAGSLAILRAKLGWASDSEARAAVLAQFVPVAQGVFASLRPRPEAPAPDVLALLAAFEAWYEATHRVSFWILFDQPMPETPLVDF